jgi:hypothetical protein
VVLFSIPLAYQARSSRFRHYQLHWGPICGEIRGRAKLRSRKHALPRFAGRMYWWGGSLPTNPAKHANETDETSYLCLCRNKHGASYAVLSWPQSGTSIRRFANILGFRFIIFDETRPDQCTTRCKTDRKYVVGPPLSFAQGASLYVIRIITNNVFECDPKLQTIISHLGKRIPVDL